MIIHIDGHDFIVDDDMAYLAELRWRIADNEHVGHPEGVYAKSSKGWLHRIVLGIQDVSSRAVLGDHIDGNTLDCRRSNLRCASPSQNQHNARRRRDNTSGTKGVSVRANGRYRAYIKLRGRQIELGTFDTVEEAAEARRKAAEQLHGRFARS